MPECVITEIHHASMIVADTAKALDFYCGILGLEQLADRPELAYPGAWLKVGDKQIHLIELPNPDPVTGRPAHGGRDRHLAMQVTDLDSIVQALSQRGLDYSLSKSGRRALFCRDYDGNALEFIENR